MSFLHVSTIVSGSLRRVGSPCRVMSEPAAAGEIAELRYFTRDEYAAMADVAPGSLMVFDRMKELGLID